MIFQIRVMTKQMITSPVLPSCWTLASSRSFGSGLVQATYQRR